ncbi:hypothetical protein ACHAWF_009860 [Thalassiosira exigua]
MMDTAQYTNPKHFNAYTGGSVGASPPRDGVKGRRTRTSPPPPQGPVAAPGRGGNASASESRSSGGTGGGDQDAQLSALSARLSQFARGADRRQVLRTLCDPGSMPRVHPLAPVWVEDIAAAEREAAGERASLNGVKFMQVRTGGSAADKGPVDSYFLQTLREICGHMCDMEGVRADPMALYGGLLLRLARSVSERDALEVVTRWSCGKGELVTLPLKRRHHDLQTGEQNISSQQASSAGAHGKPNPCPHPIDVELYVESGNVHAKVSVRHELGLYLRNSLESQSGLKKELSPWSALVSTSIRDPSVRESTARQLREVQYACVAHPRCAGQKPWVYVDADIVERINFGTGSSARMLHVSVPEDKNSGYVKKR